jgi:hypothetical protein
LTLDGANDPQKGYRLLVVFASATDEKCQGATSHGKKSPAKAVHDTESDYRAAKYDVVCVEQQRPLILTSMVRYLM